MAAPPRQPSRASTFASQDSASSTSSRNAALLGASTAFGRNAPKSKAPVNAYSGTNGAFAAASKIGAGSNNPSPRNILNTTQPPPLFPSSTGGSMNSSRNSVGHEMSVGSSPTSHLALPPPSERAQSKSPSREAASLAAARAPPSAQTSPDNGLVGRSQTVKRPAVAPKPRRLSSYGAQDMATTRDKPTDSTSIAPTTSLVDLFERKVNSVQKGGAKPEPIVIKPSKDLPIKSPKPVRTSGGITSMFQMELEDRQDTPKDVPATARPSETKEDRPSTSTGSVTNTAPTSDQASLSLDRNATVRRAFVPELKPPTTSTSARSPLPILTSEAVDIPQRPPRTATAPVDSFPPPSTSLKSLPAQYNHLHPRTMTPNMTGDQLANAMVAGSLASSRAPSPKKLEPPPPPPRRLKHHHTFSFSRTPSPAKSGMKQTLRKTASETSDSDDDEMLHPYGKHKKKRLVRKHPNKHHEGDRKRWRDAVTERERKRYEGVWAANKGLYCTFSRDEEIRLRKIPSQKSQMQEVLQEQVSNIIARDLWSRSRLPDSTLEAVWDLVDGENVGRLGKEEFVVGMWLIDQRLKGRKLPVKVSESVWASVRSLQGIKIRK